MKLDAKTLAVLKNYSQINPSILFKEGNVLTTISPSRTVLSKAKVPNTFDRRCAIYELTKLLGGISIAEDPEISFDESAVVIKDKNSVQKIPYAAETAIKTPPENKHIVLPSVDVSVSVTEEQIKNVVRGAGVYGLPEIAFVGDGDKVDRKSTRLNSSHIPLSRMPSSA